MTGTPPTMTPTGVHVPSRSRVAVVTGGRAVVDGGTVLVETIVEVVVLVVGSVTVVEGSEGNDVVLLPVEAQAVATSIPTANHVPLTPSACQAPFSMAARASPRPAKDGH